MALTRRQFLTRVGSAGGYTATFAMLQTLGILPIRGQQPEPIAAPPGSGRGIKIAVLGAGIAGLVAAYELRKLGYEVALLEARERPGGRNWTGRNGTVVEFTDGTTQTVNWQPGNYQNFGPARLPSTHWTMLRYCRELGVPMEVEINSSSSTLLQNDKANNSVPITQRKADFDTRGRVTELLSKCIAHGALDSELSAEDRERMLSFLRTYGSLSDQGQYNGCNPAGYKVAPGAGLQDGILDDPQSMRQLLDEAFWNGMDYSDAWDWQATMMQPVGGMDRIPHAFAESLGPIIRYSCPVSAIRRSSTGVRIEYTRDGKPEQLQAHAAIVTLPFSMLKKIPSDFSAPYQQVITQCTMGYAVKMPWESRRFWEQDYNIYGGLSFLNQGPSPVWYPSANLMAPTGIIVGGYFQEPDIPGFSALSIKARLDLSRLSIEKLHPGHGKELTNPIYMGWRMIPFSEGAWIDSYGVPNGYKTVIEPDGPFYFAGDTMSNIVGWQEGAALSARRSVAQLSTRLRAQA
jgi:monoamine oxidase